MTDADDTRHYESEVVVLERRLAEVEAQRDAALRLLRRIERGTRLSKNANGYSGAPKQVTMTRLEMQDAARALLSEQPE